MYKKNRSKIVLSIFRTLFLFFMMNDSYGSVKDSIFIQGVITSKFQNEKFVSIKDSNNQEYVLPKGLLEKKLGIKIGNKTAEVFFIEIPTKDYRSMLSECYSDSQRLPGSLLKLCPPKI